jgi:3',5'-cyclic AMP phosphodiesterase CpdA
MTALRRFKAITIAAFPVMLFSFVTLIAFAAVMFAFESSAQVPVVHEANSNILARVALLGDSHLNLATSGDETNYGARFEKAIAQVNAAGVDFVLIAGDLVQSGSEPEQYDGFKADIKKFRSPVWFVPGNHDVGDKFNSGKSAHTTLKRIETYENTMGPSWFSTNCAGVRIIGINSSILGSGFDRENEMWKFLESELAMPAPVPTILFMHYPLFLKDLDEPGTNYWNVEPAPRARLYNLLKQGGVKIVLNGHLHRPLVHRRDGILFVTTPPTSFGLPAGKQPEGWTLVTILKNGDATEEFETSAPPT